MSTASSSRPIVVASTASRWRYVDWRRVGGVAPTTSRRCRRVDGLERRHYAIDAAPRRRRRKRDQTAVAVRFVQGWSRRASQCALLGVFEMDGIRPGPTGRAQIKITVTVEKDGTLVVEGTDADSGMTKSAQAKAALR